MTGEPIGAGSVASVAPRVTEDLDRTEPWTKAGWRTRLRTARAALGEAERARRAELLVAGALRLAAAAVGPVCAYLPVGTEPGSPALVDALAAAGHRVLLPVVPAAAGPLDWAVHDGGFAAGPIGLREPTGPRLGPPAIGRAGLVLIPGLAVDRRGVRLGQGGGYYDRSLPLADPAAALVAVLDEGELVDELPAEQHDRRVHGALLPSGYTSLM